MDLWELFMNSLLVLGIAFAWFVIALLVKGVIDVFKDNK